jgi:hypothetical protein
VRHGDNHEFARSDTIENAEGKSFEKNTARSVYRKWMADSVRHQFVALRLTAPAENLLRRTDCAARTMPARPRLPRPRAASTVWIGLSLERLNQQPGHVCTIVLRQIHGLSKKLFDVSRHGSILRSYAGPAGISGRERSAQLHEQQPRLSACLYAVWRLS